MKFKHLVVVALVAVGVLYIWHNYSMHGGTAGLKSGLGIGH
jgi:hypothetical protein